MVDFYENRSKAETDAMKQIGEFRADLKPAGTSPQDMKHQKNFR